MEQKLSQLQNVFTTPLKSQSVWQKFILPVGLKNTNAFDVMDNQTSNTIDYVFIEGAYHCFNFFNRNKNQLALPTDYAVGNGLYHGFTSFEEYNQKPIKCWQRIAPSKMGTNERSSLKEHQVCNVNDTTIGIVPAMHLNLAAIIQAQKKLPGFGKINHVKDANGKVIYHTIEFGTYPQTKVKNDYKFNDLLKQGLLTPTGKKYTGYWQKNGGTMFAENWEYEYEGAHYVAVNNEKKGCTTENWHSYKMSGFEFSIFKAEPIQWIIKDRNWHEMPKVINPDGNGKAKFIDVRAEKAIMAGIPFYRNQINENCLLWRNSSVRSFLNDNFMREAFDSIAELNLNLVSESVVQSNQLNHDSEIVL